MATGWLRDLDGYPRDSWGYYGGSCKKYGIDIDGEPWMVKFPRLRDVGQHVVPDSILEHIGSRIYESVGIPAQETLLGMREGKVVCACKDLRGSRDRRLTTFHNVKNSHHTAITPKGGKLRHGDSTYLDDILDCIRKKDMEQTLPKMEDRFWDMFVVDTLIGNGERDNTNWGMLHNEDGTDWELAPVYDNAGCNLWSGEVRSIYVDSTNTRIDPMEYLRSTKDEACRAALSRICKRIDVGKIAGVIDEIPDEGESGSILSDEVKELFKETLTTRARELQAIG